MTLEATEDEIKEAIGIIARANADDATMLCIYAINAANKHGKIDEVATDLEADFKGDYLAVRRAWHMPKAQYKKGDTFQAFKRKTFGQGVIGFDFVVDKVTRAGLVYATGTAHTHWSDGTLYRDERTQTIRFRGKLEYRPADGSGFRISDIHD